MDDTTFRWVNHLADRTTWLHGAATGFAVWGIALSALLLLVAWWDARSADEPEVAVAAVAWAGAAALVGAVAVQLIGAPIDRARPTVMLHGTHLLLDRTTDFSFPSDHGTATAAIAFGLLLASRRLRHRWYGWAALAVALVMDLTRVYVGAHYPTDVIAGLALGALVALVLARPAIALLTWISTRVAASPLRPLVSAQAQQTGHSLD